MSAKPIVVATDGSEESLRAVDWAAREAALRGVPLRIVAAVALPPRMLPLHGASAVTTVTDVIHAERRRALATSAARATQVSKDLLVDTDELAGPPAQAVTQSGAGALMLVLGSRGAGAFTAMVLGSVSRYVAVHASVPVVVVRDEAVQRSRLIGVGIADPDHCAEALTFAFEEAALREAGLVAVHAWHMPQGDISRAGETAAPPSLHAVAEQAGRHLAALLDEWHEKYPDVPVSHEVVHGHPGRALVGLSARADLVVLGRHSKHPSLHGPGTVTHAVLSHAHGPVVTVPSSS